MHLLWPHACNSSPAILPPAHLQLRPLDRFFVLVIFLKAGLAILFIHEEWSEA